MKKYEQIAYDEAKQSKCQKRQVGAIIVIPDTGEILGQGHNYSTTCPCNDTNVGISKCPDNVIHAEIVTLNNMMIHIDGRVLSYNNFDMYITQPPCNDCVKAIHKYKKDHAINIKIIVCEQFLKFDDDKLRFDLIPPEWEELDAKVLTYGAKKYKPNNWRKGEIDRYIGAVMRHWNLYRKGEWLDPVTNLPHLAHVRTNVGFLITLREQNENNDN